MLGTMPEPSEAFEVEHRPLRRAEYDRLGQLGFFADEKVELLDGIIVTMSPINEPHNELEALLNELIVKALPPHLIARPQCSLALSETSEPEPDLAIVERTKRTDHPSHALLVVELAASSLNKDLGIKAKLYARAGIPDYWVVEIEARTIVVHRDPDRDRYTSVRRFDSAASVQALLVPEVVVCLDRLQL